MNNKLVHLLLIVSFGTFLGFYFLHKPFPTKSQVPQRQIVVDHNSVALFDQIPDQYLEAARNMRMFFMDRSVGGNINDGLGCLASPSVADAPNHCKRPDIATSEIVAGPEYNRSRWVYSYGDPNLTDCGGWPGTVNCSLGTVRPIINNYDVIAWQFSYLAVGTDSNIHDPQQGFFGDNRYDIQDVRAFEAQYPNKIFVYSTTSLSRGIGTQASENFNQQMRQYAVQNGKPLFDVADILSHDPQGNPCYDNRDGVPYSTGARYENYPDDGLNLAAICPEYTTETDGGHLGSYSTGKIRVAKAFWVLMAQLAGWSPEGGSTPPPPVEPQPPEPEPDNVAPVANDRNVTTDENTSVDITLTYTDNDGPGPYTTTIVSNPANGAVIGSGTRYTYTPVEDFSGTDSFTWKVNDGENDSNIATVTVSVVAEPRDGGGDTGGGSNGELISQWSFSSDGVNNNQGNCSDCKNEGAIWTSSGYSGGAYQFGNNGHINLGSISNISGKDKFTLSFWIKPAFDETTQQRQYLFEKTASLSMFYLPQIRDWRAMVRTTDGVYRLDTNNIDWTANTWHKVDVVYDGSKIDLYWDNELMSSKAATGAVFNDRANMIIGNSRSSGDYDFNGMIDEFKIYDGNYAPSVQGARSGVGTRIIDWVSTLLSR